MFVCRLLPSRCADVSSVGCDCNAQFCSATQMCQIELEYARISLLSHIVETKPSTATANFALHNVLHTNDNSAVQSGEKGHLDTQTPSKIKNIAYHMTRERFICFCCIFFVRVFFFGWFLFADVRMLLAVRIVMFLDFLSRCEQAFCGVRCFLFVSHRHFDWRHSHFFVH